MADIKLSLINPNRAMTRKEWRASSRWLRTVGKAILAEAEEMKQKAITGLIVYGRAVVIDRRPHPYWRNHAG